MPDKPFVINDRRKFTAEGALRHEPEHGVETSSENTPKAVAPTPAETASSGGPRLVPPAGPTADIEAHPAAAAAAPSAETLRSEELPGEELPPLTPEQIDQVKRAYDATVERLDTALRAQNLGAEPPPPITFQSVIQTFFMQALVMLGGATEPGQPVSVDPMGARQVIAMIESVVDKARPSLSADEVRFCENVLFELRMGFLEITQRLAQQAAARAAQSVPGPPGTPGGPSIVR